MPKALTRQSVNRANFDIWTFLVDEICSDMHHNTLDDRKSSQSSCSDASLENDSSDYEDDPSWSQGTVNDADWELSRGGGFAFFSYRLYEAVQ